MSLGCFNTRELMKVDEAMDIAEDAIGNHYKLSFRQWKKLHYEVKTLSLLREEEISHFAFALLSKGSRHVGELEPNTKQRDFYFICLQDHHILRALKRDRELKLLPLLIYVFAHELVHIVRFCDYSKRFEVPLREREKEERIVHEKTFQILSRWSVPKLDYVLDSYHNHRITDMALM